MTEATKPTAISDFKDVEVFTALKRMCQFIVDSAWNTSSSDPEYEFATAKTRQYAQDIKMLAAVDEDVAWGQTKRKTKDGLWVNKDAGDLNPWYEGELTLRELLDSLELLAELLEATTPQYMPEAEFLHYYDFLRSKLPTNYPKPAIIRFNDLHPKLQEHCRERFRSGQYADAILAAYKVVLNEIKDITGIHNLDGKQLVEKALSLNAPLIKLNDLATQSDNDEQLGFMMLFAGAAVGIRNPKAHDLVAQEDKFKTLRYLTFASLLLERLDERTFPKP